MTSGSRRPTWEDEAHQRGHAYAVQRLIGPGKASLPIDIEHRRREKVNMEKGAAKNMELVAYHDLDSRPGFQMAMQVVDGRWYLCLGHFWQYRRKTSLWTVGGIST